MCPPLAPQEEAPPQQKSVSALPGGSAHPQLSQRHSLEAQYLQHRRQVGSSSPLSLRLTAIIPTLPLCTAGTYFAWYLFWVAA